MRHGFLSPAGLACECEQTEPQIAGQVGKRGRGTMNEDGPVVDTLAQRVDVEDGAQHDKSLLGGVPVFKGVAMRDAVFLGVFCRGRALGSILWSRSCLGS